MKIRKFLAALAAVALALVTLQLAPEAAQARTGSEVVPDASTLILDHFNGATIGTAYGGVAYLPSVSGLGQAAEFGLGKYVKYALPGWPGGQGTIEMWINPAMRDSYGNEILSINWYNWPTRPTFGGNIFSMGFFAENLWGGAAYAPQMGTLQTVADTPLPVAQWTHLAVSWGSAGTKIYLNGVDETVQSKVGSPALSSSNWLYLNSWGESNNVTGLIDELHVSKVQRTPAEIAAHAALRYDFSGFYAPVKNLPAVNKAKAGSAVPVKFGLGMDEGIDVLATGSPASQPVDCATLEQIGPMVAANSARTPQLTYNPDTDTYQFVWKTDKSWAGTCRSFVLQLNDGTTHTALFTF